MNKAFILLQVLLLVAQISTQKTDTSGLSLAERKTWADSNNTAFTKTQLKEQVKGCYAAYETARGQTAFTSLSQSDQTLINDKIGQYQYSMHGASSNSFTYTNYYASTTPAAEYTSQIADCNYLFNVVDGADQNVLYFAAKKCFQDQFTANTVDGISSTRVTGYNEYTYYYYKNEATIAAGVKAIFKDVYDCIEDAVFYTRPQPERQFYICSNTCNTNNQNAFNNYGTSTQAVKDTAYQTCVIQRAECGRFNVLNADDATAKDYATDFAACYSNTGACWSSATDADVTALFTCLRACNMPDYSSKATFSSILQVSLALLFVWTVLI